MATSQYETNNILREWAPLTDLFAKLPTKTQNGLFSQEIKVTCIDVLPEFLALGTNVGTVYWFDRKKKDLQRLRCENTSVAVTAIKIISTVDYMVACGNIVGNVSIFQIPKSHPESIPDNLKPKNKQVERYSVSDLHNTLITAIEWSKNGMKLFSGDKSGCIVLTELDFYMHICKSVEILNEAYEVVQLSYNQQRLLVSTTYRSIICQRLDKWKVCQIGKKDRKILGNFGGIIYQNGYRIQDTLLYCTRPGLRIWISDFEGNVQKTLLFKDLLCRECPEVPIINPISRSLRSLKPQKEPSFGLLLPFSDNLIVTHNSDVVYILDPQEMSILFTISHLRGVLGVATCKDELFVLEEDRSLIRISYRPEPVYDDDAFLTSTNMYISKPLSIKDLTLKIQSSSIITNIPPLLENVFVGDINIQTDDSLIINAEEAKESPIRNRNCTPELQKKFDDIGKQDFSDKILFKKKHRKKSFMTASTNSLSSNSSEEQNLSYTRPTIMNLSAVGVLPDLRSPESINNDIEYKEKILADVLNLDKIKISLDKVQERNSCVDQLKNNVVAIQCDEKKPNNSLKELTYYLSVKDNTLAIKHYDTVMEKEINGKKYLVEQNKIQPNFGYLQTKNKLPSGSSEISSSSSSDTPACINIPNEWKLADIHLNTKKDSSFSDSSLNDWEIV